MKNFMLLMMAGICLASACKKNEMRKPDGTYNPVIDPANFTNSTNLTNQFFLFEPGKTYIYESQTEDGLEHIEVSRTTDTRVVMDITCAVVHDSVVLNGKLLENTYDWYAQDNDGNVWYMGEDVDNYNLDGTFKDHGGAWEAGVDGAKPGIVMLANPQPGMSYRQEYYFNEAEDEAEVLETGLTVTTPFGTFNNCLKTKETTELEKDVLEYKFYAPGTGVVKVVNVTDDEEEVLIDIKG